MQRAILLQTNATKSKQKTLNKASLEAVELANFLLQNRKSKRLMDLHKTMYSTCKKTTSFNSQVICDIERTVVESKGTTVQSITVKFNTPRNCKTFNTKSHFFVELGIYPRNRIAIPIKANKNYQRFQDLIKKGWTCKTFGLTSNLQIVAYLSKEKEIKQRKNILGIDINAKYFAISVVSPQGKVLYQTYFGKRIWAKRKKIMKRRALLQSLNATKKLKTLRNRERDFVKTNLGQIVREIIKIATKYDADISIEKLKRFNPKGKRFNKTVMRIPFYRFKQILEQRCFDNDIPLNIVDSWHTSKWCSHCGAVGNGHNSTNYSLFKCKCGQTVNSDRKASLAVAVKSLLVRNKHNLSNSAFFQFTNGRVSVNGLLRSDDVGLNQIAVQHSNQSMESQ